MHEIDPDYSGLAVFGANQQSIDVCRWRKAERERLTAVRLSLSTHQRQTWDGRIARHLRHVLGDVAGQTVSAYWPARGEPDIVSLLKEISIEGAAISLPTLAASGQTLAFCQWHVGERLVKGRQDILEPVDGMEVMPDVILIPAAGFDKQNYCLGYSGGLVDRAIPVMARRPRLFGVGYSTAEIPTIYPQGYDVPMDFIITERGLISLNPNGTVKTNTIK
tara:strand:- start:7932 stop:8591 length:660 start_codon:yes stop_codon:yes gene_type:complete